MKEAIQMSRFKTVALTDTELDQLLSVLKSTAEGDRALIPLITTIQQQTLDPRQFVSSHT